jgi:hypothetical protein
MNAYGSQALRGRLAKLSPFEITVPEAPEVSPSTWSGPSREPLAERVSAAELYGCVDWYQYPGQAADSVPRMPI